MKNNYFFFIAYLFAIITNVNAQEKSLDCNFNYNEALFYLKGDANLKKDSLKSIELLKPCLKIGDPKAQLLMARLLIAKKDEKNYKKAFILLKKSAKQGNAIAAGDLGVMYKYGRGCNLNFNKARKWFKKGAELGNDKATYSLGYLYLKGFGNIEQDYSKAIKWFVKSSYPMAKYWLGVCYYYGYGVEKNTLKANDFLGTDFEISVTESENINSEGNKINTSEDIETTSENLTVSESENTSETITEEKLYGIWSGSLLKFDWSGNHIEQKHSLSIEFKYDSINEIPVYKINIENQELTGDLSKIDNSIYFDNVAIKLPHRSFKKGIPNELEYQLLSTDTKIKDLGEMTYLTGTIENYIERWNESGAPLKFVLKKKKAFTNSDKELTDEELTALSRQKNSFIKLYPNPFKNDLIISYSIEKSSYVEVQITNINGTKKTRIENGTLQKAGKHRYFFNGTDLESGIYVVSVIIDNKKKTRVIVKN